MRFEFSFGQHTYPKFANDRDEVMRARAADGDGSHDHQLVQVLDVRKFRQGRPMVIPSLEHLVEEHAGHPACRAARVVVILRVDHQRFEERLHLLRDLVLERLELMRTVDEFRDIVVGVRALSGSAHPAPNSRGHDCGRSGRGCRRNAVGAGVREDLCDGMPEIACRAGYDDSTIAEIHVNAPASRGDNVRCRARSPRRLEERHPADTRAALPHLRTSARRRCGRARVADRGHR